MEASHRGVRSRAEDEGDGGSATATWPGVGGRCNSARLKKGETYNGHLVNCDMWMNIHIGRLFAPQRSNCCCDVGAEVIVKRGRHGGRGVSFSSYMLECVGHFIMWL